MLTNRFLKYISFDTQSDATSKTYPSTKKQLLLAEELVRELNEMDINATIDDFGYVTATIKGCLKKPTIGFIAHYDTASEMTGKNVKPQIIKNYDGKDIVLGKNNYISVKEFPLLKKYLGHELITTDGTTLLGADDKAGIAEIMEMANYLITHPEIKHGDIKIAFTPDEEIGKGTLYFDVKNFGADFAYTVDGDELGNLSYENFNAASAIIQFVGKSIHPGSAKDKMVNSIHLSQEFHLLLPSELDPAKTEGYEGFNHVTNVKGSVELTTMNYIIRNHDIEKLEMQKNDFFDSASKINKKYGYEAVNIRIFDSYKNMASIMKDHMNIVDLAIKAMNELEITPIIRPIRGGTDGANLTYNGLPTPNLGNGSINHHGKYEIASINDMEKVVKLLVKIVALSPSIL